MSSSTMSIVRPIFSLLCSVLTSSLSSRNSSTKTVVSSHSEAYTMFPFPVLFKNGLSQINIPAISDNGNCLLPIFCSSYCALNRLFPFTILVVPIFVLYTFPSFLVNIKTSSSLSSSSFPAVSTILREILILHSLSRASTFAKPEFLVFTPPTYEYMYEINLL